MAYYLDELIERYEQGHIDAESVCDNITRITNKEEYISDVEQNRLKERITDKYSYIRYSKSPEYIVIKWEESEKILHFLDWIRKTLGEKDWWIFSQFYLHNMSRKDIADKSDLTVKYIIQKIGTINNKIKKAIPYYTEQFGDIREYLLD